MLLRKGANVCAISKGQQTALHFAAAMGHVDVAAALLDEAAQQLIVMKDEGNWTALHHAAEQGSLEIVELLLQVSSCCYRLVVTADNAKWTDGQADVMVVIVMELKCFWSVRRLWMEAMLA